MNFAHLAQEASTVIDVRAALIAAGVALLAGLIIVLIRHRKPTGTK